MRRAPTLLFRRVKLTRPRTLVNAPAFAPQSCGRRHWRSLGASNLGNVSSGLLARALRQWL